MNTKETNRPKTPLVKESISATLYFSDIIAMSLSFLFALFTAQFLKDILLPNAYNKPFYDYGHVHDLFFIWICPIVLFLFATKGHYTQRIPWWNQVQNVLGVCLIALVMDGFVRFALNMSFSRLLIGLCWVYVFFLTLLGRQFVFMISRKKKIWDIPTVVIGDVNTVKDILFAFSTDNYTGYDVKAVALRDDEAEKFDITAVPAKYKNIEVLTGEFDYKSYVENNLNHFFVISLETYRGKERDELIETLTSLNALYAVVPPISQISISEMEPSYFFGNDVMLLHTKTTIFSPFGRFIKRSLDLTLASIALILLSPIMLLTSLFLKLEGQGGSIFYGGHRIGKNGSPFKCWKFRSMEPNSDHLLHDMLDSDPIAKAEWEKYRKLKGPDPRVTTKTARFIRKASIDELPQLWNVIKGDMSLVGPRPILEEEYDLFGPSIKKYLQVRPGITGLWQVSGRNDVNFERRVYWDSWYVRNWSFWGDIVIMIKTLSVVFGRSGAY